MLFNSIDFLLFFPLVTAVYFLLPHQARWVWLLITSYYFYMCWNAKYALLIALSTLITYASGLLIHRAESISNETHRRRLKKLWVFLSFSSNLAILFFFKYFGFFLDNLSALTAMAGVAFKRPAFDVVLPVGISFYTFQALSYTVDVYRQEVKPERNPFRYALFVSFFPQLVAGPIERSKNLLSQLYERHTFDPDRVRDGMLLMLWGMFEKIVVADRLAILVDYVYQNYLELPGAAVVLATVFFAFQIYSDFAGYSHIAIGAAQVMGFRLMENFHQPYLAQSASEFWRRWHISLSSWFRDYLSNQRPVAWGKLELCGVGRAEWGLSGSGGNSVSLPREDVSNFAHSPGPDALAGRAHIVYLLPGRLRLAVFPGPLLFSSAGYAVPYGRKFPVVRPAGAAALPESGRSKLPGGVGLSWSSIHCRPAS